jgi:hypothetical protein
MANEQPERRRFRTKESALDPVTEQRLRALEDWRPNIERRVSDIVAKIDANTTVTVDTNQKVKVMYDIYTATKVNGKLVLWAVTVLGGIGGTVGGWIAWLHR